MKKYNYFCNNQVISKREFEKVVPFDWQNNVVNGEYSYGYYRSTEVED